MGATTAGSKIATVGVGKTRNEIVADIGKMNRTTAPQALAARSFRRQTHDKSNKAASGTCQSITTVGNSTARAGCQSKLVPVVNGGHITLTAHHGMPLLVRQRFLHISSPLMFLNVTRGFTVIEVVSLREAVHQLARLANV